MILWFSIAVIGKKFESVADSKEVWYGTSYKLVKIDTKDIESWKNAGQSEKLHMPHRNEFIPEKLDLVAREEVAKHLNGYVRAFDKAIFFFSVSTMASHLKNQSTESRVVQAR